jgi:hypothetical protein
MSISGCSTQRRVAVGSSDLLDLDRICGYTGAPVGKSNDDKPSKHQHRSRSDTTKKNRRYRYRNRMGSEADSGRVMLSVARLSDLAGSPWNTSTC